MSIFDPIKHFNLAFFKAESTIVIKVFGLIHVSQKKDLR